MSTHPRFLQRAGLGLPLLAKELIEQANRRRTYVIRVLYALTIFSIGIGCLVDMFWTYSRNPLTALGYGRYVFEGIVFSQFTGIYALVPILAAGSLTEEKERNTLPLLLLTRLGPWTIVFEKVLGCAVPMLMLLLVSLPLTVMTYGMGGVDPVQLWSAVWLLPLAVFQIAALSVMCSARFPTTASSFVATIAIGITVLFVSIAVHDVFRLPVELSAGLILPVLFDHARFGTFAQTVLSSLPSVMSTAFFVVMARVFLSRSATRGDWDFKEVLGWTDRIVNRLRSKIGFRGTRARARPLPDDRPVRWRELRRTVVGQPRYQLYLCLGVGLLLTPFLLVFLFSRGRNDEEFAVLYFTFLGFVALLAIVQSAGLFSSERSRQTLDTLLTTPLSNREIVDQKLTSVFRLVRVFALPYLAILLVDISCKQNQWRDWFARRFTEFQPIYFAVSSAVTAALYLAMLTWISTLAGLIFRSQIRAIFASLITIVAMAMLPLFLIIGIFELFGVRESDPQAILLVVSPLSFLILNEFYETRILGGYPVVFFILNTLIYGWLTWYIRRVCLRRSGRLLKRLDQYDVASTGNCSDGSAPTHLVPTGDV